MVSVRMVLMASQSPAGAVSWVLMSAPRQSPEIASRQLAGQPLDDAHERRVIETAVPLRTCRAGQLGQDRAKWCHNTRIASRGGEYGQVLVVQLDAEAWSELARQHRGGPPGEQRAARQAAR